MPPRPRNLMAASPGVFKHFDADGVGPKRPEVGGLKGKPHLRHRDRLS
jgi:hypothetical protein